MVREWLPTLIVLAGICQLGVLTASALVPIQLNWRDEFKCLPRLHRQMHWVYGGYVWYLAIAAFGVNYLANAMSWRPQQWHVVCGYVAIFGVARDLPQGVFDASVSAALVC